MNLHDQLELELSRPSGNSLIAYSLQVPMGLWSRMTSWGGRSVTDTQQWLRHAQERRS
jgi:hypothetical protein